MTPARPGSSADPGPAVRGFLARRAGGGL